MQLYKQKVSLKCCFPTGKLHRHELKSAYRIIFNFSGLKNSRNSPKDSSSLKHKKEISLKNDIRNMNETLKHIHTRRSHEQCAIQYRFVHDRRGWINLRGIRLILPQWIVLFISRLALVVAASLIHSRWICAADACRAFGGASGPSCW